MSEQEYGNSQWKILRGRRGVGDLDSGGFTESVVGESLVMNNPLAVLDFLWWWMCVKDKNLIWGHVVRQVTSLRLEWPASGVYLLKFIPGTFIQLQCIYRNGGDRQWEPASQVCQHFCLVKPCSSHPFTIHSCSRGERCDGRYRKAIGKLVVSRCMPLGQIFLLWNYHSPCHTPPQPQARLHWIQNLVLKQDTEELKKISEKIYVVLTTMVHAYW